MRIQEPERFLLECIRTDSEHDLIALAANFCKKHIEVDWSDMPDGGFKAFLPIYLKVKQLGENLNFNKAVKDIIKLMYILNCERNEEMKKAITELDDNFNRHKIDMIFVKGAALLATVYKDDIGIRPMGDIDILVRKRDVLNAENLLSRMGYREDYERFSKEIGLAPFSYVSKNSFVSHYVYYKGNVKLELHWHISDKFDKSMPIVNKLFDSSTRANINGMNEIKIINPEGMIFLACTNFIKDVPTFFSPAYFMLKNKDNFYQFLFFCYEIKKIIMHYKNKVSWDNFIALATEAKNEYEIFSLLLLAQKIANIGVPDEIIYKIGKNFFISAYIFLSRYLKYDDLRGLLFYRAAIHRLSANYRLLSKNPLRSIKSICGILKDYLYYYSLKA